MPSRLSVQNEALRNLGQAPLATLVEDTPSQAILADVYDRAVTAVLREADWRFALATEAQTHNPALPAYPGFSYKFDKPASWLRTHAFFIQTADGRECPFDARDTASALYANVGATTVLRYVSSDATDEGIWTEHFAKAVSCFVAHIIAERVTGSAEAAADMLKRYDQMFQAATERDAVPPWPWLPFMFDGTFLRATRAVLEEGAWRFATVTDTLTASGTPSVGYAYRYPKPADFLRVVDGFEQEERVSRWGSFRDENGAFHSDQDSFTLRYVSTTGVDATTWTEAFSDAVLARCQYEAARYSKDGASALALYKDRLKAAEYADEGKDRPRIIGPGRVVAARLGGLGRWGWNREQGWPR